MSPTESELALAVRAVREAARLAAKVQAEMVSPALTKDDKSPVTVADFAVQALVAQRLAEALPDAVLVAEEDAAELRGDQAEVRQQVAQFVAAFHPEASEATICDWIDRGGAQPTSRFWTLDPIDGTKGFLRGDQYAVALALIEDGRVVLGALGCPNLERAAEPKVGGDGSVAWAVAGQGAFHAPLDTSGLEGQPLKVSPIDDPARARLLRSMESGHTDADKIDELAQALGNAAEPVRMDSQAKYAVLAAGQGDVLLRLISPKRPDYKEKIWDQAAGLIVVQEAGGTITDLDGKPLDFRYGRALEQNRGVCATNGALHQAILNGLRQVSA